MSRSSSVEDLPEQCKDLFTQDGVLLKACLGRPVTDLNSIGMLCIVQNQDNSKTIEWRPNDLITIDSDTQDQEWAVVNTIGITMSFAKGRRQRTLSGNITSDYATARARIIKIPIEELKTFRVTRNNQQMQFSTKPGVWQTTFYFQHGNAEIFVAYLKNHVKTAKTRHDRNTYVVVEPNIESQVLNKSFAELDIFTENTTDVVWNLVSNFKQRPYETTMEAFSKLTDIVYYGNEGMNGKRDVSEEVVDLLTKSMNAMEEATTVTKSDEYEVISVKPTLPPRPSIPRGTPLSPEKWWALQDTEGRITEVEGVKQLIFRGGVAHSIRQCVWKYLLDYHPWHMTSAELKALTKKKTEEYFAMKLQWRSMTEGQEARFSEYRDRKSLVEKDVNRTDRTHPFFAGDNNPNLVILQDILLTYVMYNFDLGYVQGMSDILAPLLLLLGNEVDSFWCFVGFMDKIASNFDMDQAGMKHQLLQLQQLLTFASPELANHLAQKDSGNMYFCFRWLLVWFKREFSHRDIMRLWEVLWTSLPCANFHLLICVAILDAEKDILISKDYGFTEILKHVNDLSMCLDVDKILSTAEGIFHQIMSAPHLTDQIRIILGLPPMSTSTSSHSGSDAPTTSKSETNGTKEDQRTGMFGQDMDEVMYQIGLDMSF
ncbi:TBC1 domain family member 15 isoform X2 [Spodoptera litura]|uniref:TBC1 domain family member 15 n=1 Tax=Spodoptera litura TaxID=69820 RepID=A0A9J7IH91_SPOLT|nr:TBC1 domain family member 15 isoform X2 [Spodoptera litura]XP_022814349.1 TBC1 domain family member 15 isoform X2 [Spodoptera litura]